MPQTRSIPYFILVAFCCLLGCRQSPSQHLRIAYQQPDIPDGLQHFFTPDSNQRASQLLKDGETRIDMHAYYLSSHRAGWDDAAREIAQNRDRQLKKLADVYLGMDLMKIGCEAYWQGYETAYSQFEKQRAEGAM